MQRKKNGLLICCAATLGAIAARAGADTNLVTNGGWETSDMTGWTLTGADTSSDVSVVTNKSNLANANNDYDPEYVSSGNYGLRAGPVGRDLLSQTITSSPTDYYTVSFDFDYHGDNEQYFQASFGGVTLTTQQGDTLASEGGTNNGFVTYTFSNVQPASGSTSSLPLDFTIEQDSGYQGLDNISVVDTGSNAVVPEPAMIAPVIFGMAGMGMRLRRRVSASR